MPEDEGEELVAPVLHELDALNRRLSVRRTLEVGRASPGLAHAIADMHTRVTGGEHLLLARNSIDAPDEPALQRLREPALWGLPRLLAEGARFELVVLCTGADPDEDLVSFVYLERLLSTGGVAILAPAETPSAELLCARATGSGVFTRATTEDAGGAVFLRKRDRPPGDDVSRGSLIVTGAGRRRFPSATSLTAYRSEWHRRELEQRNAVLTERLADAERRAADLLTVRAQLADAEQRHGDSRAELEQRVAHAEAEATRLRQALEEATLVLSQAKAAREPDLTSRRRATRARLRALKHLLTRR